MLIKDPIQLFQEVTARMNAQDFAGAAGLCDPVSLASFRRNVLRGFAPGDRGAKLTAEQLMKQDPAMPREVAEYQVKQFDRMASSAGRLKREFPNVPTVEALRSLEPADLYGEFLYGRSPARQLQEEAKEGKISKRTADAMLAQPLTLFDFIAIGSVADGDNIAHVVYRNDIKLPPESERDRVLQDVPEEERQLQRDVSVRGNAQTFVCRKQADGGWLAIADYAFIGSGMAFGFHEEPPGELEQSDYYDAEPSP